MLSKLKNSLRKKKIKYSLEILIVILIYYSIQQYRSYNIVDGVAPRFNEVLLDGSSVKLSNYQGKAVLLHFWATWCPICTLEQDSIQAISQNNKIITVAMNSGEQKIISEYMQKNNLDFPVIIDEDGTLARLYGITGVPTSIIINSNGEINYTEVGYTSNWGLRARLWLTEL